MIYQNSNHSYFDIIIPQYLGKNNWQLVEVKAVIFVGFIITPAKVYFKRKHCASQKVCLIVYNLTIKVSKMPTAEFRNRHKTTNQTFYFPQSRATRRLFPHRSSPDRHDHEW